MLPLLERSPFAGRRSELELLRRWVAQASAPKSRVLIVTGEAGIGKSRLTAEAAALAQEKGLAVGSVACFEQDALVPYALLFELLSGGTAMSSAAEAPPLKMASDLAQLARGRIASEGEDAPPNSLDSQDVHRRFTAAVVDFAVGRSADRPALLIVEDLHWCDEHSLEVIRRLAHRTVACPLLLLVTYRADEAPGPLQHMTAELLRARLGIEIELGPLGPDEVDLLIRGIFGQGQPVRRDFIETIGALTDGNPFFIEEVLGALVASGDVFRSAGTWDRLPVNKLRVPRTIQDAVQRRAAALSAAARELLVPAAVLGRRFEFALLEVITEHDVVTLLRLVKELVTSQFVVEEAEDRFAFRHALTREAMLVGLLARELRAWHARCAAAIEQRGADSDSAVAALAHHYFEAGDWQRAHNYAERAGQRAQAMYAPRAAVEQFSRAIEAATHASDAPPPGLLRARGQARETLGLFEAARADYEAALTAATAADDWHAEWQSSIDLGFLWAARDYARARPYLERALALARAHDEPLLVARSLNRIGNWLVNAGRSRDALPLHEEALRIFEAMPDAGGVAETMDLLGLAAVHSGAATRAVECYERAATLYREQDHRTGMVTALVMLAEMGSDHPGTPITIPPADPAQPLNRAEEAVAVARSIDWRAGEAYALMGLAYCLTGRGEYGRSLEAARAGLAIAEDIEHHQWSIASHLALGGLYLELHAATLAQAEVDRAQAIADAVGSAYWTRMLTAVRAGAAVMESELERADALIQLLASPDREAVDPTRMLTLRAQVELALASGDAERALARIDEFVNTATQQVPTAFISLYVWLLQGEVLRRLGHGERAAAVLEMVLQAAVAREASPLVWRAHVALGRLAQSLGRRAAAGVHFDAARAIVDRLASDLPDEAEPALGGVSVQAHFLAASMACLPRQRGATSLRTDKALHGGLTARERQVAALIARGKSNREIAAALVVADRTVETHIGNIFAKLGSNSRARVAAWAVEKGLGASTE